LYASIYLAMVGAGIFVGLGFGDAAADRPAWLLRVLEASACAAPCLVALGLERSGRVVFFDTERAEAYVFSRLPLWVRHCLQLTPALGLAGAVFRRRIVAAVVAIPPIELFGRSWDGFVFLAWVTVVAFACGAAWLTRMLSRDAADFRARRGKSPARK